jgi:hypothetical protein
MQINASVDITGLAAKMKRGEKNLLYSTVQGINDTALKIQEAERQRVARQFKIRKPGFIFQQAAIIKPFASVKSGLIYAEIAVGQKNKLLLSQFEKGGERLPFTPGAKSVAVPITGSAARENFAQSVNPKMFIRALNLKKTTTKPRLKGFKKNGQFIPTGGFIEGTGGKAQIKGKQRTFMLKRTGQAFQGGIFMRIGPEKDDIRLIYSFKMFPRLKPILGFIDTARSISDRWLTDNITSRFIKGMR